jgi:hypothetical protein
VKLIFNLALQLLPAAVFSLIIFAEFHSIRTQKGTNRNIKDMTNVSETL